MKFKAFFIAATMGLLSSSYAHAGFVNIDWKTEGDSKATLHQETGIAWLKLNQTAGMSMSEVRSELGPNGAYSGWRLPTGDEVEVMASSLLNLSLHNEDNYLTGSAYKSRTDTWRSKFSTAKYTKTGFGGNQEQYWFSYGLYKQNEEVMMTGTRLLIRLSGGTTSTYAYIYEDYRHERYNDVYANGEHGVFLVSDGRATLTAQNHPEMFANNQSAPVNDVSTPMGAAALGFSLFGLASVRRKRHALANA